MNTIISQAQLHWQEIAPFLTINSDLEYSQAVERLNILIDEIGTDETHSLYSLLDTLGILIEAYEEEHYSIPDCDGVDILNYLIEEHSLSQSELPEIGSQGVVSEILNGKRELNVRQIKALAARFNVSPAVFF